MLRTCAFATAAILSVTTGNAFVLPPNNIATTPSRTTATTTSSLDAAPTMVIY
jgi:hypothetical protein